MLPNGNLTSYLQNLHKVNQILIQLVLCLANYSIIRGNNQCIINIFLHKTTILLKVYSILFLLKKYQWIICMVIINMRIINRIILHNINTIILNNFKDIIINNITTQIMYKVSNQIPIKSLSNRLITNLIMAWVNMYQNQNNQKILSSHSLNLIMVLIKIITIKLKINLMVYKHKKFIILILKTIRYKILR